MHMPPFHQAEHFARQPAHLERLTIKLALKWVASCHYLRYPSTPVVLWGWRLSRFCFLPNTRIGFADHFLAEIDADQIVLKNIVIEHVLGRLTQVNDPFRHCR